MAETRTEIHLVDNLQHAFNIAHDLGALGIGLDVEGVLTPYVGNNPTEDDMRNISLGPFLINQTDSLVHKEVKRGLMTNNENNRPPGFPLGFVRWVAIQASVQEKLPFVHKDMLLTDGTTVRKKPSGHQGILLSEMLEVDPKEMVLIDDQGVKNAGEAVKAGFKAIIVPNPTGHPDVKGRIIEHKGVMRLRPFERRIYASLEKNGNLAALAFGLLAGIELNQISDFVNHRSSN